MWADRNLDEQIYDHRPRENGGPNHIGISHSQTLNHNTMQNGQHKTNGTGPPRPQPIYGLTTMGSLSTNHINHIDAETPDLTGMSSATTPHIINEQYDENNGNLPPPPPVESNYSSVSDHPTLPLDGGPVYGRVNHNHLSQDGSTYGSIIYGRIEGPIHNPNASDLMNSVGGGNGIGVVSSGYSYGLDNDTSMMMMMATPEEFDTNSINTNHDLKMNSAPNGGKRRSDPSILKLYAMKLGLNDRGCYITCALAAIAFCLLVVVIALTACWPDSRLRHSGPLHFCTSPPCLEAAADILGSQNSSYDPCTNFWDYACGSWISRNPIPSTRSKWSTIDQMEFDATKTKARLIATTSHEPSQINSIEWKVHSFYSSCMALEFIESDREKPVLKLINSMGGWEVLRSFNLYAFDSHRVIKQLHADYGVNAFFKVDVVADVKFPGRNIIRISPSGLGMPHKSYYQRLPDDPAVLAYQVYLKDSAQLFGAASPEAHKFSIDMFNFEKRLAEITPDESFLNNPVKANNRMTVKDLHTASMNVPWLEILKAAYSDAQMSEETEILVVSPRYCSDIAVIISTTDRASLNNYMMWQMAATFMPYLSKPFREIVDLYRKSLTGIQREHDRWEFCEKTTERFFSYLITAMFAESARKEAYALNGEQQKVVKKYLFDYLKHNVAKSITLSDNYDYPTRRAAIEKLKNMTIQIGTPTFLLDRAYLKILYKDLLVQKTDFFQNILYGVIYLRKREENKLISPSEETRWLDAVNSKNVEYIPSSNKVVVPEILLRPPLFHPGFPNSVNMGGLGFRVSEAMLQGVIGQGLLFDSSGRLLVQQELPGMIPFHNGSNPISLYSDSSGDPRAVLEKDSMCLISKYVQVNVDDRESIIRGKTESTMTVAALRQAYVTLEDILELEKGIVLPAMETYDPQAIFFLSFAQSMCTQRTDQQYDVDRTSHNKLLEKPLLIGALSQFPEFHHFFYCGYDEDLNCGNVV